MKSHFLFVICTHRDNDNNVHVCVTIKPLCEYFCLG